MSHAACLLTIETLAVEIEILRAEVKQLYIDRTERNLKDLLRALDNPNVKELLFNDPEFVYNWNQLRAILGVA